MKHLRVLLLTIFLMLFMPAAFADVSVYIDDTEVVFEDQNPITVNNRVLVPMRKIFEELGAYVDWIGETNTVFATKRFQTVALTIGSREYYVDGNPYPLDVAAVVHNSRTLVPVRVIAESLGADVIWDGENNSVLIYSKQGEYSFHDKYINYWEYADDGTVIMTGRTAYPQITSDNPVSTAFNEYFYSQAEECTENKRKAYYETALSAYNEFGQDYIPYMAERNFNITYNNNGIISILFADSDFTGGFHPGYELFSETYNMQTGKKIDCADIIGITDNKLRSEVKEMFTELIDKNPESYYYDAKACLDAALSELKWYLAEDGVHFFLNPYEISPYSNGVVEVIYYIIQGGE